MMSNHGDNIYEIEDFSFHTLSMYIMKSRNSMNSTNRSYLTAISKATWTELLNKRAL